MCNRGTPAVSVTALPISQHSIFRVRLYHFCQSYGALHLVQPCVAARGGAKPERHTQCHPLNDSLSPFRHLQLYMPKHTVVHASAETRAVLRRGALSRGPWRGCTLPSCFHGAAAPSYDVWLDGATLHPRGDPRGDPHVGVLRAGRNTRTLSGHRHIR